MAVKTLIFIVLFLAKAAGSHDCDANQKVSCEHLRSSRGFTYTAPSKITCSGDCEPGWYFQNGTFIVDPSPNASDKRLPIVQDVTSNNLTISVCENLQWQFHCGTCKCFVNYTVTETKHSPQDDQDGNHSDNEKSNGIAAGVPPWGAALIGIVSTGAFIGILFCCFRMVKLCMGKCFVSSSKVAQLAAERQTL